LTHFTRRQYANSDCNRDCVQATISDLVYLLRTISGDTGLVASLPLPAAKSNWITGADGSNAKELVSFSNRGNVIVREPTIIGGASFIFDLGDNADDFRGVELNPSEESLTLLCSQDGSRLRVSLVNFDGDNPTIADGRLFSLVFDDIAEPSDKVKVTHSEFSDNDGNAISLDYIVEFSQTAESNIEIDPGFSLTGYPNPFNNSLTLNYSLPSDGYYKLTIYDIMGRKVKTLIDGYRVAGTATLIWDGTDDSNKPLASGTYFTRLQGETGSHSLKLFMLK